MQENSKEVGMRLVALSVLISIDRLLVSPLSLSVNLQYIHSWLMMMIQ
jgi:hypothetical protein